MFTASIDLEVLQSLTQISLQHQAVNDRAHIQYILPAGLQFSNVKSCDPYSIKPDPAFGWEQRQPNCQEGRGVETGVSGHQVGGGGQQATTDLHKPDATWHIFQ